MNRFRPVLALLLALLLALSMLPPALAADGDDTGATQESLLSTEDPSSEPSSEPASDPASEPASEPDSKPAEPAAQTNENHVADMYLCYRQSSASVFGHAWIYIENLTNETLQVGAYRLPPNQGVSAGSFAFRSRALGTHYNVEAWCGNHYSMSGTIAARQELSRGALNSVSSKLLNTNFWGVFFNCAAFAATIWNAGSSHKVIPLLFPVFVQLQIQSIGTVSSFRMYSPRRDQVVKQNGTGSGATLSRCPDGPLQKEI